MPESARQHHQRSTDYSFVVPIYNDGYLAGPFCKEFQRVFSGYLGSEDISGLVELIFVNDGSSEESSSELKVVASRFPFVRVINLSRNFGQHVAISCGYQYARGNVVGMMNADMQESPEEIPKLLHALQSEDADIVFGLRRSRAGAKMNSFTSRLFGVLLNKLTGYEVPLNVSTLRVMRRRFVDAYNSLGESCRYLPGLESWLGFKRGYVEIEHHARTLGKSSYDFGRRLKMASEAIISFSDLPLRITVAAGFVVVLLGFALTLALVLQRFFFAEVLLGYTSTIAIVVFLGGVQLMVIGLASLYIGRILREVQRRPVYLIKSTINLSQTAENERS
jgi:glycosyltransferase involved in cell wall biosynthesis